jgi:hypothetical protein
MEFICICPSGLEYTKDHVKAIDDDGWYSSEKNDQWLPLQPNQLPLLDFRNGNRDFIPKVLLKDKHSN